MSKHTPGPWTPDRDPRIGMEWNVHILDQRGHAICFMAHSAGAAPERDEANAALIAAAPDLLAVAQFFLRGIEGGHIRCAPYIDFDPNAETLDIKSPAARLREAIAAATGVDAQEVQR